MREAFEHSAQSGATFIHAFEDPVVIAGQGTIGLELADQVDDLGTVVRPGRRRRPRLGNRDRAAGVRPGIHIVGVQAAACAPLAGGRPTATRSPRASPSSTPASSTSALVKDLLDEVVTVSDEEISQAIVLLLERVKLVVEGAGAAAIAALLAGRIGGTGPVTALLSGGNIDPTLLIQVMRHGLTLSGRYLVVRTRISDRPGELSKLLALFAEERANVVSVEHHREGMDIPVAETEVEATLLTRDEEHCAAILDAMRVAAT